MLAGQQPANLRRAVFLVENTYLAGQLTYPQFTAELDELVNVCRRLAGPNASPTRRFMALHQLMTDTVRIGYDGKPVGQHLPYRYDFADYRGEQDHTKQFVSKLLRTSTGQCHSLPLLYKLLADALQVPTYLSLAPNHSYIQIRGENKALFSYETTNHHFVTDAYYMSTGYVKASALRHRTYLDTLTRPQTLACRVVDLALGYDHRYGPDEFVKKCAELALRYYPHYAQARMLVYNVALAQFTRAWAAAGKPTPEQARTAHPTLVPLWQEVERSRRAVEELGHEEMPAE
jgi:hypothetical protein